MKNKIFGGESKENRLSYMVCDALYDCLDALDTNAVRRIHRAMIIHRAVNEKMRGHTPSMNADTERTARPMKKRTTNNGRATRRGNA